MLNIVTCEVKRIIDGDTLVVDRYHTAKLVEKDLTIRLLDVWAPENRTEEGEKLTEWVKDILDGQWVLLETNNDRRDSFGRLLGIIYPAPLIVNNKFILDRHLSYNAQINEKVGVVTTNSMYAWKE